MYRIFETQPDGARRRELGSFDCPYNALRELRGAVGRSDGQAWLQLVDPNGVVLVDTSDILEESRRANANSVQ